MTLNPGEAEFYRNSTITIEPEPGHEEQPLSYHYYGNLSARGVQLLVADVPYKTGEVIWGVFLLLAICIVNGLVLWVVGKSRELWDKPRHLWMACLSFTDLFVAGHKGLELLLLIWPMPELCVLKRTTLGIPYVINVCVLSLLSLDRFVAVRYPFHYSSKASTKHVLIGFSLVMVMGMGLAGLSITLGLQDEICKPQRIQLVTITIILTICSILIFMCNFYVLRVAKRQIDAIEAQTPTSLTTPLSSSLSVASSWCKTVSKVPHLISSRLCCHPQELHFCHYSTSPSTSIIMSMSMSPTVGERNGDHDHQNHPSSPTDKISIGQFNMPAMSMTMTTTATMEQENGEKQGNDEEGQSAASSCSDPEQLDLDLTLGQPMFPGCSIVSNTATPITMPFTLPHLPVILSPADLNVTIELQSCHPHETSSVILEETTLESHQLTDAMPPLSRAMSMPTLPKSVTLVIPGDPTLKATAKMLSSNSTDDMELGDKGERDRDSTFNSRRGNGSLNSSVHSSKFPEVTPHNIKVSLPRSRSFTGGKKFSTHHHRPTRHNFLKGFHLTGSPGLPHAWRLMPSRRFAITVLVIMIPMWLFLTPIVTIVPLQRQCLDQQTDSNIDCEIVSELWAYLQIHMRSIVPLQAILDTLIYCCGSKEFRRAFKKIVLSWV